MNTYKIRAIGEVLDTTTATRRIEVYGQLLTFGREPVYLQADELPPALADDLYLKVDTVDSAPAGAEVIELKAERVQEEMTAADPGDTTDLKAERVQEELAAAPPDHVAELKAERVQEPNRKRR